MCHVAQPKKTRKENQAETLMGLCPVAVGKPAVFRNGESGEVSAVSSLPPACGLVGAAICAPPTPLPRQPDLAFPVTNMCSHAPGKCVLKKHIRPAGVLP